MTGSFGWDVVVGIGAALILAWVALIVTLAILRPPGGLFREAVRILPDVLRLIRRLAADKTLPSGVRTRLWLLLVYLALPFDLIPDFIPVLGYAVRRHWPGSDDGFAALCRLAGLIASTREAEG